jgi:2-polyprenyl-3-methyl-5-hydroxy-6-metoxy-1,4-benzoquinol methylase
MKNQNLNYSFKTDNVTNADLKELYEDTITFTKPGYGPKSEFEKILNAVDDHGKAVLEIGCGTGDLAARIAEKAGFVIGVDYCEKSIEQANINHGHLDNIIFHNCDYREMIGGYDIIVMQGVLEHLDDPLEELGSIIERNLPSGGMVITSSPSFMNPRGLVLMTISLLFDLGVTMADLHYIMPEEIKEFCDNRGYGYHVTTSDMDWGNGNLCLADIEKRLRSDIFKDRYLDKVSTTRDYDCFVDRFMEYFKQYILRYAGVERCGANMIYTIRV